MTLEKNYKQRTKKNYQKKNIGEIMCLICSSHKCVYYFYKMQFVNENFAQWVYLRSSVPV